MKHFIGGLALLGISANAVAMDIDWSGQFRAETNLIQNYTMDSNGGSLDAARFAEDGYYIPGGGENNANFQTLFFRLKPKLIVNDNIYVKSEWWLGDPSFGIFGNALPYTTGQRQFYSNQSRGSTISAQRFWLEAVTDFGTAHVGRAPLHWGLGLVWSAGDDLWDRDQTTGDMVRLVSRFGAFTLAPAFIVYSSGNTIGGACAVLPDGSCAPGAGHGATMEYSLLLKYENMDEDWEGGVNFVKRLSGAQQDPGAGYLVNGKTEGMNFNIWDIAAKKRLGNFTFSGEMPITTGTIAGLTYSTLAFAGEVEWKGSERWGFSTRLGRAPGQPNIAAGANPDRYETFTFHPNYRLAMIMFNYQLANFAGPQTTNNPDLSGRELLSPYDNPITNANYIAMGAKLRADKWTFNADVAYARAHQTASTGQRFFNTRKQAYSTNAAISDQEKSLGWEVDLGATLQWDDNTQFGLDTGLYFPGDFFKFSNTATENATSAVWATVARVGVSF